MIPEGRQLIKSGIKKVHLFIAKKARHLDELWLIAIFQLRLAARFSWPLDDYADVDAAVTCRFHYWQHRFWPCA